MTATLDAIAAALGSTAIPARSGDASAGTILIDGATDIDHGPGLWLRCGSWGDPNRVVISGVYPRTIAGEVYPPSYALPYEQRETYLRQITVSASKPTERIAREIERRFLPEYRRLYALCLAHVTERNASLTAHRSARDRLAAVVPMATTLPSWRNKSERERTLYIHGGPGRTGGEVEIAHDGDRVYRLELTNLSLDDAEWILRFVFERG